MDAILQALTKKTAHIVAKQSVDASFVQPPTHRCTTNVKTFHCEATSPSQLCTLMQNNVVTTLGAFS